MCHHAGALRVSQPLSDPPLPYSPCDTHNGSLAALPPLGNPAPRSGPVFVEQAGRVHREAAWLPLPRQPGPTRLLSLLSHPGFICWLGPRLPPACLGFHNYNQPACALHLSLLGGSGGTADRSGQQLKPKQPSSYKRHSPGKLDQDISSSHHPGRKPSGDISVEPSPGLSSPRMVISLEDGEIEAEWRGGRLF